MSLAHRPVNILLVEDNETDVLIAQQALEGARVVNRLEWVDNGEDALKFLSRQPPYEDVMRPDIILLDWNLPRINGQEVLERIKTHDDLKRIPVVVLTTSKSEETVLRAYNLHANSYVSKPLDLKSFRDVLLAMEQFWLQVVTLPPRGR